jgi:hypothetical protein
MTRVAASTASVSWIDPSSPAGAHVPDSAPPATATEAFLTGNTGFRFSNYLNAWVDTPDGVHLTGNDFAANAGLYRGPSYLGIPSHAYPVQRARNAFNEGGIDGIEFEQTTGARTISPGVIGGAVGGTVGLAAGGLGGAKVGALIGAAGGPIGAGAGAVIGGLIGAGAGYFAGTGAANYATNFPPIWTRLKLRLKADGARSHVMTSHSHFPSNTLYGDLSRISTYSALAPEQTRWENGGWGGGNPWGITRPTVTP